jgi:hypothetical protein
MPSFEVIIQCRKDGVDLAGFPFRRTIETNEGSDFNVIKADGDVSGQPFPGLISGSTLQLFVVSTDQPVAFIPGGAASGDGIINLLAGGLFLLLNSNETGTNQIEIKNAGTQTANCKGAWGGT